MKKFMKRRSGIFSAELLLSAGLVFSVIGLSGSMAGCGWLVGENGLMRDRKSDYLKAAVAPPLKLPAGMAAPTIEDLYVIPPSSNAARPREFEVPRPSPLLADISDQKVRIQKLQDQQWILVAVPPSQLWTQVREFLLLRRIGIVSEAGQQGTIDTAMFTTEGASGPERYRFHIEQGVQRNMSEVHVLQSNSSNWPEASAQRDREDWMVKELSEYFASSIDRAAYSLVAQGINTSSRLDLMRPEQGSAYLLLKLPAERAWASLGYAMKRSPLKSQDVDRSAGTFYARYLPPPREDDKPNWFMGIFKADPEYADVNYAGNSYVLSIKQVAEGVEIRVQPQEGTERRDDDKFTDTEAEFILGLLKGYLT
jgi:outer membrane protein assembly factor BamC